MIRYLIAVIEFDVNMLQINLISWNGNMCIFGASKRKYTCYWYYSLGVVLSLFLMRDTNSNHIDYKIIGPKYIY